MFSLTCINKKHSLIMVVVAVILGCFLSIQNAYAVQPGIAQTDYATPFNFYGAFTTTQPVQNFTAITSAEVESLQLRLVNHDADRSCQMTIWGVTDTGWNGGACASANTLINEDDAGPHTWNWSSSCDPLVKDDVYNLALNDCAVGATNYTIYGTATSTYTGGAFASTTSPTLIGTPYTAPLPIDVYFVMLFEDLGFPNVMTISPTPLATCDFAEVEVFEQWSESSHTTQSALNGGWYSQCFALGFTENYMPYYFCEDRNILGLEHDISYSALISFPTQITEGFAYYAKAYNCDVPFADEDAGDCDPFGDDVTFESDVWEFIVIDEADGECPEEKVTKQGLTIPFTTSTSPIENLTCDQTSSFWESSMCKFWNYLFVPSTQSLERFALLKDRIEVKPPAGYYTIYKNQLLGLSSATTTSSTIDVTTSTLPFYLLGEISFVSSFLTITIWFIWIIFVFYLYKRFKYLEI